MGYVAVKGGQQAIDESNKRLAYERVKDTRMLNVQDIKSTMRPLIAQVMSESSLYDIDLAALAIKQAGGSSEEAVFLLRAHRSTLPRLYYTTTTDTATMVVERRISSSFKDIPGGQILGTSNDFKQRFLNFDLINETLADLQREKADFEKQQREDSTVVIDLKNLPKVIDYLAEVGLYHYPALDDRTPDDITKKSIQFPASRSQRLQSLTRGQTGAVTSLGYAEIRSFGVQDHPNIGELRVGKQPLHIQLDSAKSDEVDEYYIGAIEVTEVEGFMPIDVTDAEGNISKDFVIGYGFCFGQNETKAIAMSVLDYALEHKDDAIPTANEEFVLSHIDSVESTGFISHLKLPHYVTFQSKLDGMRKLKQEGERRK